MAFQTAAGFSGVHSLFLTRMAASSTTAFDRTFIASATSLSKAAGLLIVGLTGQRTTTALRRSLPGSTSSMVSVWPLRWPTDSGVDDWDKAELAFRLGPGERLRRDPGPTYGGPRGERPGSDLARMLRAASITEAKSALWLGVMFVGDTGFEPVTSSV
jgi:hypothetical protein